MITKRKRVAQLRPRMRVLWGEEIALGPGKLELLAMVGKTGSIREAAEKMGMSYMRAWTLIQTINACFKKPLVDCARGGKSHGGARLTPAGRMALGLYQKMEKDCLKAAGPRWRELRELLRD